METTSLLPKVRVRSTYTGYVVVGVSGKWSTIVSHGRTDIGYATIYYGFGKLLGWCGVFCETKEEEIYSSLYSVLWIERC